MKIAIFGAAGAIGRVAVPELLARGHSVRVVGRNEARLRAAFPAGVECVAADLADPAQARRAADGVDGILYSVGVPYDRFVEHPKLMRTTVDAARAAGVRKLIQIGTVYVFGRPRTARVSETHPREPRTRKGAYRKEQEDITLGAHDPEGLHTLVLRLPDFYGPTAELSFAKMAIDAIRDGKTAYVIGPLDRPHEWIYVPDAAAVIADLFERDDAFGTDYNLAGLPTTVRAFYETFFRVAGRSPKMVVVPTLMIRAMGLFNPLMREMVEMLYLFEDPVLLDDAKLQRVIGPIRHTPYEVGAAQTLQAELAPLSP